MTEPLWVFGYGSLLWNPGFEFVESQLARLYGYHRSFCMSSIHHRGTEENPGLVLALDEAEDTYCDGLIFRVAEHERDAVLAYLRERELISSAYLERFLTVHTREGQPVNAVCYVVDRAHRQYVQLPITEQVEIIARARGGRGANTEYLYATAEHLVELGIEDAELSSLTRQVRQLTGD